MEKIKITNPANEFLVQSSVSSSLYSTQNAQKYDQFEK